MSVTSIAARSPERAREAARRHGIPHVMDSYEEVLEDRSITAIYIPTPAALHARWTAASISAGKHVLVEKPFTSAIADAQWLSQLRPRTIVMEAYHSHYHPQQSRIAEIIKGGEIGEVRHARAAFNVPIPPGKNIRWSGELGGGSLLDLGYYPVRLLRALFGEFDIVRSRVLMKRGVDRRVDADLRFGDGMTANVTCSIWSATPPATSFAVTGSAGQLVATRPYHAGGVLRIRTAAGSRKERCDPTSSYDYQLAAFRHAILTRSNPETNAAAAVSHLRALEAIRVAGTTER